MDNRVFQCYYPGCLTLFSTKFNLVRHVNTRHIQVLSFPCKRCGKILSSKASLQSHERTHGDDDEFERLEGAQPQPDEASESLLSLTLDPQALPGISHKRQYSGKLPICSNLLKKVARRFA